MNEGNPHYKVLYCTLQRYPGALTLHTEQLYRTTSAGTSMSTRSTQAFIYQQPNQSVKRQSPKKISPSQGDNVTCADVTGQNICFLSFHPGRRFGKKVSFQWPTKTLLVRGPKVKVRPRKRRFQKYPFTCGLDMTVPITGQVFVFYTLIQLNHGRYES